MKKNILVVAAHPDDEILGCGGTLIKLKNRGYKIQCIFLADGETSRSFKKKIIFTKEINLREKQAIKISRMLKFNYPKFFRFPDNKIDQIPLINLVKVIENEIKHFKPSIIFTNSSCDLNIDHSRTCKAVLTATRPFSKSFVKKIYSFEIASNSEMYFKNNKKIFIPNLFSDIGKQIRKKIKLIKIYSKEIRKFPHPRSAEGVKVLARYRASQSGLKYAEAFEILRDFV